MYIRAASGYSLTDHKRRKPHCVKNVRSRGDPTKLTGHGISMPLLSISVTACSQSVIRNNNVT